MPGGEKGNRHGGGFLKVITGRFERHQALISQRKGRKASGSYRDYFISNRKPVDPSPYGCNGSRALCTERSRITGIKTQRVQYIAEVEACGCDLNLDLAWLRSIPTDRFDHQVIENAFGRNCQMNGIRRN